MVKAINDTAVPNGLDPSLLVVEVIPRIPINPRNLPDKIVRLKDMKSDLEEAARMTAQPRLLTAIST